MKKLVSILLALAMILCLSIPAFAAEEDTTTIIINQTEGDTGNRTYNAYRLLDLKVSHKDTGHDYQCPADDGGNHVPECYNYAYTISNATYLAVLQQEVFDKTESSFWTELKIAKPATAAEITEAQILTYLSKLQGDNGTDYSTLRKTTDRIYNALPEGTLPDATLTTGTNTNIPQGYWLIVDAGNPDNALTGNDAYSVAILNTAAKDTITITPKVSLPELEKKVKDTNDTQHTDSTQHDWTDAADHDINDVIPFKLTATLPNNMDSFDTYKMIFHDTMEAGLTLVEDSFKIYLFNNKFIADEDTDLADMTPIYTSGDTNANFAIDATANAFSVTINDAKAITGATGGNAIVIIYKATLNENAQLGATGNANTAYLEYSNDPYSDNMGTTAEDTVKVFTYGLSIHKIDNLGHDLKGAGFTLYKQSKAANGEYLPVGVELGKDADGNYTLVDFLWEGLDNGNYKLVETTVPTGFNELEPIYFTIASSLNNDPNPSIAYVRSQELGGEIPTDGIFTLDVINNTGSVLPSTGAEGTFMLITGGTLLVVVAAVFMITRKKMSVYED